MDVEMTDTSGAFETDEEKVNGHISSSNRTDFEIKIYV